MNVVQVLGLKWVILIFATQFETSNLELEQTPNFTLKIGFFSKGMEPWSKLKI